MLYLLKSPTEKFITIKEIANHMDVSFFQLSKVANKLTKSGVLLSHTGPHGGVRLAKDPEQLKLFDIVTAIEGPDVFEGCVLGLGHCGEDNPCPVHNYWRAAKLVITKMFKEQSLKELRML